MAGTPDIQLSFAIGELAWGKWYGKYYKGKIMDYVISDRYGDKYYAIRFLKYKKKWDTTTKASDLLPITAKNEKYVKKINAQISKQKRIEKQQQKDVETILNQVKGKPLLQQPPFLILHKVEFPQELLPQDLPQELPQELPPTDVVEFGDEKMSSEPEKQLMLNDQHDLINSKNSSVIGNSNCEVNSTLNVKKNNLSEATDLIANMSLLYPEKNNVELDCINEEVTTSNNNSCLLQMDDEQYFINSKNCLVSDKPRMNDNFEEVTTMSKKQLADDAFNSFNGSFNEQSSFEVDNILNTMESNTSKITNLIITKASELNLDDEIDLLNGKSNTLNDENNILDTESNTIEAENNTLNVGNPLLDDENNILDPESNILEVEDCMLNVESPLLDGKSNRLDVESHILDAESNTLEAENNTLNVENPLLDVENNILDAESHKLLNSESHILNGENNVLDAEESFMLDIESPPLDGDSSISDGESNTLDVENPLLEDTINNFEDDIPFSKIEQQLRFNNEESHYSNGSVDRSVDNHNLDEEVNTSNTEEQLRLDDQHNFMNLLGISVNDESCSKVNNFINLNESTSEINRNEATISEPPEHSRRFDDQHNFINSVDYSTVDLSCCYVNNLIKTYNTEPCFISKLSIVTDTPDVEKTLVILKRNTSNTSNETNSSETTTHFIVTTSLLNNQTLPDDRKINITNNKQEKTSNITIQLETKLMVDHVNSPADKKLDCEVSDISKFKDGPSSRNCSIETTTSLTNIENNENKKQKITEKSKKRKNSDSDVSIKSENLAKVPANISKDKSVGKKQNFTNDIYESDSSGIACSTISTMVINNKRKINYNEDETDRNNHVNNTSEESSSTLSNTKRIKSSHNEIINVDHIKKLAVHKKHKPNIVKKKYRIEDFVIADNQMDNSVKQSKVSYSTSTATANITKIKNHKEDVYAKKSQISSSVSNTELQNEIKSIIHNGDNHVKKFKSNSSTSKSTDLIKNKGDVYVSSKSKTELQNENNKIEHKGDDYVKTFRNSSSTSKTKSKNIKIDHKDTISTKGADRVKKLKSNSLASVAELNNENKTNHKTKDNFDHIKISKDSFSTSQTGYKKSSNGHEHNGEDIEKDDHYKEKEVYKNIKKKKSNDLQINIDKEDTVDFLSHHKSINKSKNSVILKTDSNISNTVEHEGNTTEVSKPYNENWSWESASSSTSIPLSNHPIDSDDDINGQTTDDDDQYVKNRKVSKKNIKPHDTDNSIYQLFGYDKTYSRAAKVKANEAISQMSKPPIIKEKKNDKRSKFGKKKDEDDPWYVPKLIDYNLEVPKCVNRALIEDKHLIVDDRFITILPAKLTVQNILRDYAVKFPVCEETLNIVLEAFNQSLFIWLLHPIERPKYKEMLRKYPNKPMCQIYGLPHLLRFIMKLPKLFHAFRKTSNEFIPHIVHFTRGLFVYLVDEDIQISVADYDCVMPDYYRMSYFS